MALQNPAQLPAERDSNDHADCGRLAVNAVLRALGHDVDCHAKDNANAAALLASIHALGLPGIAADTIPSGVAPGVAVPQAIGEGRYVVVGVRCDGNCRPSPPYPFEARHWLAGYGAAGQVWNPWNSAYETWNLAATHDPDMDYVRVWSTATAGIPDNMSNDFAAHVILTFTFGRGYGIDLFNACKADVAAMGDIAAFDKWAGIAASHGEHDIVQRLTDLSKFVGGDVKYGNTASPDNLSDRVTALETHTAPGQGSGVPDHKHAVSAVTGSPQ